VSFKTSEVNFIKGGKLYLNLVPAGIVGLLILPPFIFSSSDFKTVSAI